MSSPKLRIECLKSERNKIESNLKNQMKTMRHNFTREFN